MEILVVFDFAIRLRRHQQLRNAVLLLPLVLLAPFATARGAEAQNLLTNPDFDVPDGLATWQEQTGSVSLGTDSGTCATSSAVDATSGLSGGGSQYFFMTSTQCIPVDPATNPALHLAGMYTATADVYARIYLQFFSDTGCSTPIGFSATLVGGTSVAWNRIADTVAIDANAGSVLVLVDGNPANLGEPQFTMRWDRFYLGVEPQIFRDDFEFESGSACHWSAVVGGL